MATSTKIRPLAKLIDGVSAPFWVVDPNGCLVFLSAATAEWLGVDGDQLVGRTCLAGASIQEDPLDYLAASLSAPPGFHARGTARLLIQPTFGESGHQRITPRETRFVRLGESSHSLTLAIAGDFDDESRDVQVDVAVLLRKQLDRWRQHHESMMITAMMGESRWSRRMRRQSELAAAVRSHVLIKSPSGCLADSVAAWVHARSAPGEMIASIDGPLMDAELLDASLGLVTGHLNESDQAQASAVLGGADETPVEAQIRLLEWVDRYKGRLRIIAIATPEASLFPHRTNPDGVEIASAIELDEPVAGLDLRLADLLCGLSITLYPLSQRVDDIAMTATSILDRRRASGDTSADRFSRAALDALVIYPWPDNLRELDQAIRHAARVCRGDVIGPEHLPLAIRSYRPNESVPVAKRAIDLDRAVARYEAELIRQTLVDSDDNRAEAARRLNISRARLLRKIESMDLENTDE